MRTRTRTRTRTRMRMRMSEDEDEDIGTWMRSDSSNIHESKVPALPAAAIFLPRVVNSLISL